MSGFISISGIDWVDGGIDPQDLLDFTINLYPQIGSDPIISVTWDVETGISINAPRTAGNFTSRTVTVWLENGVLGSTPLVTAHVVTTLGRKIDKSFRVEVKSH